MTHPSFQKGDESPPKDDLDCREGWQWLGEWEIDKNRAVDALGGFVICLKQTWNRLSSSAF